MSNPEERLARRGGAVELLRIPAALFSLAARLRSGLYDRRLLPRARADVPVVSVGNLTAGGTGKTPFVVWLCRELERRGLLAGVLARGYGRAEGEELNEEGKLIASLLPRVPQVQDPNRVAGSVELEEHGVDVIVLDDGFQHRRLARDLDLVCVDATRPFGLVTQSGESLAAMLPRGLLREPPSALGRADGIVLTRVDSIPQEQLDLLCEELLRIAPGKPLIHTRHAPASLRRVGAGDAPNLPLEELAGRPVLPLCGIGHPRAFLGTLEGLGAELLEPRIFPDHHRYGAPDLDGITAGGDQLVVTTAKDAVKLEQLEGASRLPLYSLDIELELLEGHSVLEALLDSLPEPRTQRERSSIHAGLSG